MLASCDSASATGGAKRWPARTATKRHAPRHALLARCLAKDNNRQLACGWLLSAISIYIPYDIYIYTNIECIIEYIIIIHYLYKATTGQLSSYGNILNKLVLAASASSSDTRHVCAMYVYYIN